MFAKFHYSHQTISADVIQNWLTDQLLLNSVSGCDAKFIKVLDL